MRGGDGIRNEHCLGDSGVGWQRKEIVHDVIGCGELLDISEQGSSITGSTHHLGRLICRQCPG